MKSYHYNEQVFDASDTYIGDHLATVTEKQILDEFWDFWKTQMIQKFGAGDYRIIPENCIDDWVVVYDAWESKWE